MMLPNGDIIPLTSEIKKIIQSQFTDMASKALRTLAVAVNVSGGMLHDYTGPQHKMHSFLMDPTNFIK